MGFQKGSKTVKQIGQISSSFFGLAVKVLLLFMFAAWADILESGRQEGVLYGLWIISNSYLVLLCVSVECSNAEESSNAAMMLAAGVDGEGNK